MLLKAEPLSQEAFKDFGDVISVRPDIAPTLANAGTAKRYNFLSRLENLRGNNAEANLCLFHCQPQVSGQSGSFEVSMLERHPNSTQVMIPMSETERYLVVVGKPTLNSNQPNLADCRAFLAGRDQGIAYKPGTWHHPLIAMDKPSDFFCVVNEDQSDGDCDLVKLTEKLKIVF